MSRRFDWTLAGLSLATSKDQRPNSGFWFETHAAGFDLGEPDGVLVVRKSLLLDGDDEHIDHYSNRTMSWTTAVCGYTFADLQAGERELAIRMGGPALLVMTPPEDGAKSVFWVRTSTMRATVDDLDWIKTGVKYQAYTVTVRAAPFAFADEVATESFTPGAGTVTLVDGCTANTNWPGMTTATYLGASVVRKSETGSDTWVPNRFQVSYGPQQGHWTGSGATILQSYTGSVPVVAYVYLDIASSGDSGDVELTMASTSTGSPIAFQALASGFTRYFWPRPSTGAVALRADYSGVGSGETVTLNIDQFGTSTTLPSGSLFALNMRGSVRVQGQLVVGSDDGLGETLVYSDPSMVTYGWQPDLGLSWPNAPEGTYWLYVQPGLVSAGVAYVEGDVFSYTIAGQTCTTRTEWAGAVPFTNGRWFPIGPYHLGSNRSRRLGVIPGPGEEDLGDTIQITRNGVQMELGCKARLIRSHPSASLLHVRMPDNGAHANLFIDPPTFDQPIPGIYAGADPTGLGATSVLDVTDNWAWPVLQPPTPALWLQCQGDTTPTLSIVSRPAFHTLVAD